MINCTFENGNKASLRHAVVDCIVTNSDQILLIKRDQNISNGGKWAIPGGYVDRDETCVLAAARELKEETNLDASSLKLYKIIDDPNRKGEDRQNIAFVYEVEASGKPIAQKGEVEEIKWFNFDSLPPEEEFAFDHYELVKEFLNEKQNL